MPNYGPDTRDSDEAAAVVLTNAHDLLAALEAATAEAATYRGALAWIRDGLDQMYSVTNEHGLRRLPPELENHAGIIGGLHRTAIIALGENPDGGPR